VGPGQLVADRRRRGLGHPQPRRRLRHDLPDPVPGARRRCDGVAGAAQLEQGGQAASSPT
jgi:hypothetical protein